MAHDVFISYSSADKTIADAVVAGLERKGIRCWVAPRDLTPGVSWGQGIAEAVETSRVMVVILSENSNQSKQVAREVERAISKDVTVIPFRIENIDPTGAIAYFISSEHWLDAITPPMERHIDRLGNVVKVFLQQDEGTRIKDSTITQNQEKEIQKNTENQPFWAKISTKQSILGILVVGVIFLAAIMITTLLILPKMKNKPPPVDIQSNNKETSEEMLPPTSTDTPIVTSTSTPTLTATFEPTWTPTPTATLTPTSTPTLTLTNTSVSVNNLSEDWYEHTSVEFAIGLPEQWEVVDIDQEGMSALMSLLSEYDPAWAELIGSTYENGTAAPYLLWAMDTEKVENGYANVNIVKETLPFAAPISMMCSELDDQYAQAGINVIESDCSLEINNIPAARYIMSMSLGSMPMQMVQYLIMNGKDAWVLSFGVEEPGWLYYEPIFEDIAETFTILE